MMIRTSATLFLLLALAVAPSNATAEGGADTRFFSLKWERVNVRAGPGFQYPIRWVFRRKGMPVLKQRELDNWFLIRDWQGEEGWVHRATVSARRTVIVVGAMQTLRAGPGAEADAVARIQGGVIGALDRCAGEWCRVEMEAFPGWMRRGEIWGVSEQDERR